MYYQDAIRFEILHIKSLDDPSIKKTVHFLDQFQLVIEQDVSYLCLAYHEKNIIACAGLAKNIIKNIAIAPNWQGTNLSGRLLTEMTNLASQHNEYHLFIYTTPDNIQFFRHCGFYPLVSFSDKVALLENTPVGIRQYCQQISQSLHHGKKIGAIVMNANPFTLGHLYLVEQALAQCDWLHIFVVSEDASTFSTHDRFNMVKLGVAHLEHISIHPGSYYIISRATFPSYFIKDKEVVDECYMAIDLLLFRQYIAPALNITHRFVGEEPFCVTTAHYNQAMHHWLNSANVSGVPSIEVTEIERKITNSGLIISASEVRKQLKQKPISTLTQLLPLTTINYLK